MEHCDVLSDCGFVKPIATLILEDKVAVMHSITLHHVTLLCKADLDQICKGIQDLAFLKHCSQTMTFFKPSSTYMEKHLLQQVWSIYQHYKT